MRKAGLVAVTVVVLSLALVAAGCGEKTTEAKPWVTVAEYAQNWNSEDDDSKSTTPFELTGAPCRLRYETVNSFVLQVYLVPKNDPTNRQSVLDRRDMPPSENDGETTVDVEPGTYYLEIEGLTMCLTVHLWLEEQRSPILPHS